MWEKVETIPDMLRRNVRDFPDGDAVVAVSYTTGEWVRHTWNELDEITDRVAAGLHQMGLRKGMKVVYLQGNCMENFYTYLAVHKLGAVFVPINIRLVAREVGYLISDSGAEFIIAGEDYMPLLEAMPHESRDQRCLFCIEKKGHPIPGWANPFSKLLETEGTYPPEHIAPEDDADIIYTSGTTGVPKGVILTHANKVATGRMAGAVNHSCRSHYNRSLFQTVFPFFTSAGIGTVTMQCLYYAKTLILEPAFDVLQTLETIQREKPTDYGTAPSMLIFLLDHPKLSDFDVSSIKAILYGGSNMPEEIIRRIFNKWPGIKTYNYFGLTEAGPGGTGLILDGHDYSKAGSVGVPWPPDQEVRIVDESGKDKGVNQVGEFVFKGPNIMKGYHNNPEATRDAIRDGWLYSGDLGYYDEDGYFYYTDRKKDMIVRGGFNVYPVEVENVLHEHPAVFHCAVVGKPHPKLGEDIVAFIVLNEGQSVTAEDIIAFCSDKLADYKRPREIIFVDSLPVTAMGKLDKKEIRKTLIT